MELFGLIIVILVFILCSFRIVLYVYMMAVFKSILGIASVFGIFTLWMYFLTSQFANYSIEIKFPRDINGLKVLSSTLKEFQLLNFGLVMAWFCSVYIYKQTFAIPGSVFTNILGGALFGTWLAFPLVCFLAATGASCCFLLSKRFGRNLLIEKFPDRIASLQQKVIDNQNSLFYFLLSARLFPGSPNWFLNLAFPVIGVPILPFYLSVLFGLMPYNFICVHTGDVLSSISSMDDVFTYSTLFGMLLIALMASLPGLIIRKRNSSQHEKV